MQLDVAGAHVCAVPHLIVQVWFIAATGFLVIAHFRISVYNEKKLQH